MNMKKHGTRTIELYVTLFDLRTRGTFCHAPRTVKSNMIWNIVEQPKLHVAPSRPVKVG